VCVAGKGKDLDHRKCVREERGLPEFSFDYCFPGDDFGYFLTILVGRERTLGMTFATTVPEKGSKGKFVADRCLEFFAECGFRTGDIVIKSDQEAAIKLLVKDLAAERGSEPGHKTLIEESPVQLGLEWGSRAGGTRSRRASAGAEAGFGGEDWCEGARIALHRDVLGRVFCISLESS
jgi:hypothetical protein